MAFFKLGRWWRGARAWGSLWEEIKARSQTIKVWIIELFAWYIPGTILIAVCVFSLIQIILVRCDWSHFTGEETKPHRSKLVSPGYTVSSGTGETWTQVCKTPKPLLFLTFQSQRRLRSLEQSSLVLGRWCTVSGSVFQFAGHDLSGWVKVVCLMNSPINNLGRKICPATRPHGSEPPHLRAYSWKSETLLLHARLSTWFSLA